MTTKALALRAASAASLLLPLTGLALILVGRGNDPVHDAGWPEGSLAVANLPSRVAWWEGPPFGGGQWQFQYRGDTMAFAKALIAFAAIRAPELDLVLHDGPRESPHLRDPARPDAEARIDWTFTVWNPESWQRLRGDPDGPPNPEDPAAPQTPDPPRLDLYLGGGGVDWARIEAPAGIRVRDERAAPAGPAPGAAATPPASAPEGPPSRTGRGARLVAQRAEPATEPTSPETVAEIEAFYAGVDAETKALLQRVLSRGIGPGSFTPEGALDQLPRDQLGTQQARWLALIEGDRCEAIENLGAARCTEAVPALLRIATDRGPGDSRARWLAIRALGRIGDERAVPELIYLVNHADDDARLWARASLFRLTGQWFGADRDAWGNWWNEAGGEPKYTPEERYPQAPRRLTFTRQGGLNGLLTPTAGIDDGRRAWGPEQAAGQPDTHQAGDIQTAWASLTRDEQPEWLELEYEKPVTVAAINIHETYNPGAVSKVTAFTDDGTETTLWEGQDTTRQAPAVLTVPAATSVRSRRLKVYLDSPRVPGWNEIDAVELVGNDGSRQWARSATASSTYAEPRGGRGQNLQSIEEAEFEEIR